MIPASTTSPPGRTRCAKLRASSHSGPHRMLASSTSVPCGRVARLRVHLDERPRRALLRALSAVASQRLRIDVEGMHGRGPELRGRQRQHARAAAIVDDASPRDAGKRRARSGTARCSHACRCRRQGRGPGSQPPPAASCTCSWSGHTHRRWPKRIAWKSFSHSRSQTRSGTWVHWMRSGAIASVAASRRASAAASASYREQAASAGAWPQAHFARCRLEHRVVLGVEEGDRERAGPRSRPPRRTQGPAPPGQRTVPGSRPCA